MGQDRLIQYVSPEGHFTPSGGEVWKQIPTDVRLRLYRWMVFIRAYDQQCIAWQKQGKIMNYPPFGGQEASQVGSALALREEDWLFPTYRDTGASLVKGLSIVNTLLYWQGKMDSERDARVLPPAVPIATHLLHAVGVAWASKLRGKTDVALALFGDGATSEGDFHEASNFATVIKTPVIFFCQNNGYAISTPSHLQSATSTVTEKAQSYAMSHFRVDGNDVLAVYDVTQKAVKQARERQEAILIEAVTYRLGPHTTSDDPSKYRSALEEKDWKNKDPLQRYQKLLVEQGLLSLADCDQLHCESERQIRSALDKADAFAPHSPKQIFAHVYDKSLPSLQKQQKEAVKGMGRDAQI